MRQQWELETKKKQSVILSQKVVFLSEGVRSTVAYHFCPIANEESFDESNIFRFDDLNELIEAKDHKGRRLAHREVVLQVKSWDG